MATARKLPSGSWRCLVYDHSEPVFDAAGRPVTDPKTGKQKVKRIYASFTSDDPSPAGRREAEAAAAAYAVNKKELSGEKITFGDALKNYIDQRAAILSPASIREYRRSMKNFDDLKDVLIPGITQEAVQEHINQFSKTHSPKSVRDNHALITAVLRSYRPNFALNTSLPKKHRPDLYIPSDEDIRKVIEASKGTDMELPILLAAFGPMRRGEICALQYEDIHGRRVHVCRNMVLNENREFVLKDPKSYAGNRFIDFPDFVANRLTLKRGRVTHLNPNMITSRFRHILIKAGVPLFRFHDLRHYCASILHAIGIPDAYIMERGGWGNDGTLKSVYRHALEDQRTKMTEKANNYFTGMQHEMQHEKEKPQ